jgi:hypothetical protein
MQPLQTIEYQIQSEIEIVEPVVFALYDVTSHAGEVRVFLGRELRKVLPRDIPVLAGLEGEIELLKSESVDVAVDGIPRVVRGSDLEEGESEGLPVKNSIVG